MLIVLTVVDLRAEVPEGEGFDRLGLGVEGDEYSIVSDIVLAPDPVVLILRRTREN